MKKTRHLKFFREHMLLSHGGGLCYTMPIWVRCRLRVCVCVGGGWCNQPTVVRRTRPITWRFNESIDVVIKTSGIASAGSHTFRVRIFARHEFSIARDWFVCVNFRQLISVVSFPRRHYFRRPAVWPESVTLTAVTCCATLRRTVLASLWHFTGSFPSKLTVLS